MKKQLSLLLLCIPFFCFSQTLDSTIIKQVDSLIAISNSLWRANEHAKAEPIALQAKDLAFEKLGSENATYAACLHNLGGLYYSKSDERCITFWEEALALRERVLGKLHPDYAKTLNNVGNYYKGGDNTKAEKILLEALEIKGLTSGKESLEYSRAVYNLAQLYQTISKPDEALRFAEECFAIREKLTEPGSADFIRALNILANAYFIVGRYDEASAHYRQLLATGDKNSTVYIGSQCNLASLLNQMGKYEEAESWSLQALEVLEKIGDQGDLTVLTHQNLGNSCFYLGRYEEAVAHHEKILPLDKISKNEYARTLMNLGNLALYNQQFGEAERYLLLAKDQYEILYEKEHFEQFEILNNLGKLYLNTGHFEQAETLLNEAFQNAEKLAPGSEKSGSAILNIGLMYMRQGRYATASQYLLDALNIWQKTLGTKNPKVEEALFRLQLLYLIDNKIDQAVPLALQSDSLRQTIFQRSSGFLTDREMAALLRLHSKKNDVLLSIAALSDDRQMSGAAYNNALFYKGFSLESNLLLQRVFRQSDESGADIFLQWKGMQRRLANEYAKPLSEQKDLPTLETWLNDLEKQLTRASSGFGNAHEIVNWQQVQAALQPGEAAIEFYHFDFYKKEKTDTVIYIAMLIRPGDEQPHLIKLFSEKQLSALLVSAEVDEQATLGNLYKTADLYKLLWQPLEPFLQNTQKVWCSPEGLLHRIAFASILAPDGKRLGEKYSLSCLGSTRQMALPNPGLEPNHLTAAIFGGIRYDVDTAAMEQSVALVPTANTARFRGNPGSPVLAWEYLQGSQGEAEEVSRLLSLGGYRPALFDGVGASEAAFKRMALQGNSPGILHVATHGYFFSKPAPQAAILADGTELVFKTSEQPLIRSGLIFAGANYAWKGNPLLPGKEDGVLTAYEISQLNLSGTALVVLSACDSGLGDILGSEGVYGLQRAFKMAGVKQLVMSLWQVPDDASRELMGLFYTHLLRDKMPVAEALQQAQRTMEQKYPDPFYWAGFVVVE